MEVRTILLVEDNRDDELLTLDAMRNGGVTNQVAVVRDGAEALDYLFAQGSFAGRNAVPEPCVVLLDLKLPKVAGMEVLRRMKSDERTRRIPVVVLTTFRLFRSSSSLRSEGRSRSAMSMSLS